MPRRHEARLIISTSGTIAAPYWPITTSPPVKTAPPPVTTPPGLLMQPKGVDHVPGGHGPWGDGINGVGIIEAWVGVAKAVGLRGRVTAASEAAGSVPENGLHEPA